MTTAVPEPRPVSSALLAWCCAATGREEEALVFVRRLIYGCHVPDANEEAPAGEAAGAHSTAS